MLFYLHQLGYKSFINYYFNYYIGYLFLFFNLQSLIRFAVNFIIAKLTKSLDTDNKKKIRKQVFSLPQTILKFIIISFKCPL